MMKIEIIKPDGTRTLHIYTSRSTDGHARLREMYRLIGGDCHTMEHVALKGAGHLWCDEDGKAHNLEYNHEATLLFRAAGGMPADFIVGTVIVETLEKRKNRSKSMSVTATRYPEHEKVKALAGANQAIGEFLEWFEQDGRALASEHVHTDECDPPRDEDTYRGRECGRFSGDNGILYTWEPPGRGSRIDRIVALYFGIDRDKLEDEKIAMLDEIRAART